MNVRLLISRGWRIVGSCYTVPRYERHTTNTTTDQGHAGNDQFPDGVFWWLQDWTGRDSPSLWRPKGLDPMGARYGSRHGWRHLARHLPRPADLLRVRRIQCPAQVIRRCAKRIHKEAWREGARWLHRQAIHGLKILYAINNTEAKASLFCALI